MSEEFSVPLNTYNRSFWSQYSLLKFFYVVSYLRRCVRAYVLTVLTTFLADQSTHQGRIYISTQSVHRFGRASTIFTEKKTNDLFPFLVVVLFQYTFYVCMVGPPMWWHLLYTCTLCTLDNPALALASERRCFILAYNIRPKFGEPAQTFGFC